MDTILEYDLVGAPLSLSYRDLGALEVLYNYLWVDRCTRSSTDEGFLMKVPFCKTEPLRKSYFNRIVYLWNSLPQDAEEI